MRARDGGRVLDHGNGQSGGGMGTGGGGGRVSRLKPSDRSELVDPRLERVFLYSAMMYPELIVSAGVRAEELSSTAHRVIFDDLVRAATAGEPTGTFEVRTRLAARNLLAVVGGDEYLSELADGLPTRTGPWVRIRELAARRRISELAALVHGKAGDVEECERYLTELIAAHAALAELSRPTSRFPSYAEAVMQIGAVGTRLPTGLRTLDDATRGGVPLGRFVAVLGAPGSSKTNFVTWLADAWERAGCAVLFLAADESRESIVTRFGQLDGFDRGRLECADDGGRRALARQSGERALAVIDPFEDRVTLEQAETLLAELAGTRPRVLIVDSLQTVPSEAGATCETKREQIEAVVGVCKAISKRGALVVAVSEMSRAGYRHNKADENISALAAGAESRAIEYAAHLMVGLRPVKGEKGVTDVEVAKNRLGSDKPDLRLRLDFETLGFSEIERPNADDAAAEGDAKRFNAAHAKIVHALRRDGTAGLLRTVNAIVMASKVKKSIALVVVRDMTESGELVKVDGAYRLVGGGGWTS